MPLAIWLAFYTACFAVAVFGSWRSRWLDPTSGMLAWPLPVATLEVSVISRFLVRERSFGMMLVTVLAYGVPPVAAQEYRLFDRIPLAVYKHVAMPLPWDRTYTLGLGIVVYLALMFRAVWIYRNRRRLPISEGVLTQDDTGS